MWKVTNPKSNPISILVGDIMHTLNPGESIVLDKKPTQNDLLVEKQSKKKYEVE